MNVKGSRLNRIMLFALLVYIIPFVKSHQKRSDLIYILEWTTTYDSPDWPYGYLKLGRQSFKSNNCSFQNCYITSNRAYFKNVLDYDVLIINAVHYNRFPSQNFHLPSIRSQTQQYLLFSIEPAAYNRVPDDLNGKINLTWTYKLNSDIVHPYIIVKNNYNEIIGPKPNMHWSKISDLPPINSSILEKLKNKRLAAVWLASNCNSKNRLVYIVNLQYELYSTYGLQLDIYGRCGIWNGCLNTDEGRRQCYEKIERDYYFYMAFENSNSEDYVSEKVLHGLNHFTVPIVYGGADYRRFLPDGIYLNAKNFDVEGLAKEMYDIINDPPRYYDFFKWHGYYRFEDASNNLYKDSVCEFCAFLNNEKRKPKGTIHIYNDITDWWNVPIPNDFSYQDLSPNPEVAETKEPENTTDTTWISNILDYIFALIFIFTRLP